MRWWRRFSDRGEGGLTCGQRIQCLDNIPNLSLSKRIQGGGLVGWGVRWAEVKASCRPRILSRVSALTSRKAVRSSVVIFPVWSLSKRSQMRPMASSTLTYLRDKARHSVSTAGVPSLDPMPPPHPKDSHSIPSPSATPQRLALYPIATHEDYVPTCSIR